MNLAECRQLVAKLQRGKITRLEEGTLVAEILRRYRPHLHTNYLYSEDEIKEEFLIASWNTLYRAKLTIGDPIAFACNRGYKATIDYYRRVSSERLIYVCEDCNTAVAYDRRNVICKKCGGELISYEREETMVDNLMASGVDFTDAIIMSDNFTRIINFVIALESLSSFEKKLVIEAINKRENIYSFLRKEKGKSHKFSKKLQEKINRGLVTLRYMIEE
jgi:DNA-directed RNA polymerase subunit RPC12/RpoP